jgi:uncharacterized protein
MQMSRLKQISLIILGPIFIALGILGIFLPLLPTTPFLLLGASCSIKGSPKLYSWLIGNKWLGKYIENYREGKGIPLKTKVIAVFMLWTTILFSIIFVLSNMLIKIILLLIALGTTWHILSIKSLQEPIEEGLTVKQEVEYRCLESENIRGEIYEE